MRSAHSTAARHERDEEANALGSLRAGAAVTQPVLGSQVVLDLYECETDYLDDLEWVKRTLVNAARASGATIVETVFHQFSPWGISGVVVIAESHLAIHIWPENRYAAVDVFTCGESVQVDAASAFLTREFRSGRAVQRRFTRGEQVVGRRNASQCLMRR